MGCGGSLSIVLIIFFINSQIISGFSQSTDCERERGRHCHQWAQCERRQEDARPRCYCSPGYQGDGYNCHQRNQNDRSTDCEREQGRHCHKWAQCERRQGDQRPRCYCSPGYGGDGYNCHRNDQSLSSNRKCPPPNSLNHGSYSTSDGSYKQNTRVTYRCQDGYRLLGNTVRTCGQNGQWSGSEPRCEQVECRGKCQRPQNIDGGITIINGGCRIGSRVSYRCNQGMMIVGTGQRTCQPNGRWSGVNPRCEKATDCERENGKHCHKWAQCERRQDDRKPRCYCSPGYSGDGYNCQQRSEDECQKRNHHTCHRNADCVRISDDKYACRCRHGHKGDGIYCSERGCQLPQALQHGLILSQQVRYVRGNVISYRCEQGYSLRGVAQRTCRNNGRWSGTAPKCESVELKKTCRRPQDIQNGAIMVSDWNLLPGTTIKYECRLRYRMQGNSVRTCQNDGRWSGFKPICKEPTRLKNCQRPRDIPHGTIRSSDGNYGPNTIITYECHNSYTLQGNSQRTCLRSGQWSGSSPRCEASAKSSEEITTRCSMPQNLSPNGHISLNDYMLKPGAVVGYRCHSGWRLQGDRERRCQDDGQWSGRIPKCIRLESGGHIPDKCHNSCHKWAKCVNNTGQPRCACQPPYYGDGYYCRACDGGQSFVACAPKCPPTCENLEPDCEAGCDVSNKCICTGGKLQRSQYDRTCVNRSQCSSSRRV